LTLAGLAPAGANGTHAGLGPGTRIDPGGLGAGDSDLAPAGANGTQTADLGQECRLTQWETSAVSTGKRIEKKGGTKL